MEQQSKYLGLEGLRGLACLAVAIGHFTFVFFPYLGTLYRPVPGATPAFEFEKWVSLPPFSLVYSAGAAVAVFFVMSGYVLTTKFFATGEVGPLQAAAAKRYIRLVLPSFAWVVLAWILWRTGAIITARANTIGAAGWVSSWYVGPFSFLNVFTNGLVGAPLFAHTQLNPPLWTIQVELIGSILLFAMFALFGRRPILLLGWFAFFADVLGFKGPGTLFYLAFLVGAFLTPWLQKHQRLSVVFIFVGLVGVAYNLTPAFAWLRTFQLPDLSPTGPNIGTFAQAFWNTIGAILLVAGVIGSRGAGRLLGSRVPVFLGKISFSVYIVHMPLLMSVGLQAAAFGQSQNMSFVKSAMFAFVVYITVVMLTGSLFQRLVDAPSMKLSDYIARRAWRTTSRTSSINTSSPGGKHTGAARQTRAVESAND
jgi:peptidoglycan/LPS O-acetylase OafA/YrhL